MMQGSFKTALLATVFVAGACSTKPNPEGMTDLRRMLSAVQDMDIVFSAGVRKDDYEKRLTDALLKFGKTNDACKQAIAKFAERDQSAAAEACRHLRNAMAAYALAKEYFGPKYGPISPDFPIYTLNEEEYAEAKGQFPNLEELPIAETNESGYKFYMRGEMLQALWKVANQESEAAKGLVDKLGAAR